MKICNRCGRESIANMTMLNGTPQVACVWCDRALIDTHCVKDDIEVVRKARADKMIEWGVSP